MRRTTVALIPIVGALLFAACSDNRDATAPPNLAASRSVTQNSPPSSCSFSTMRSDANQYFPSNDAVFTMISDMKSLFGTRNGGAVAATPKGFDILTRTAEVRRLGLEIGTDASTAAAAGGKFVSDVVGCMDVGTVPAKFLPASALLNGVFEVRGNGAPTGPALAMSAAPGVPADTASPLWGAEPAGADWTRSAAPYGRYLVYGYPLGASVRTAGFELGTLPASLSTTFASSDVGFRVGLCISQTEGTTAANRLVHSGHIVIVTGSAPTYQGTLFCLGKVIASTSGTKSWFASVVGRATSIFAPKSLSAQEGGFYGIGGLPDGWSPFNPNSIAGSSIVLSFGALPKNVKDSVYFDLVVHASTTDSPALNVPGLTVTLTVANNSGTPAQAVLIPSDASVPTTDANGDAKFHIAMGKPGGYTITATGDISGVKTAAFTSLVFNIKN